MKLQFVSINLSNPQEVDRHQPIEVNGLEEALIKTFFVEGYTPTRDEIDELLEGWTENEQLFVQHVNEELLSYFFKL